MDLTWHCVGVTDLVPAVRCLVIPSNAVFGPSPPCDLLTLGRGPDIDLAAAINDLVGGWFEVVGAPHGANMYLNQDGKALRLPENIVATTLARQSDAPIQVHDFVAGQVVVVGGPDVDGSDLDVPDEFLAHMESLGCSLRGR